jgi:hypothetical protein
VFPDIEALLVAYLADRTGRRVVTDLPADLTELLPIIRVACGSGQDDTFRLDHSIVDVDVFGADRADASAAAGEVREWLLTDLHTGRQPLGMVTGVRTVMKPRWLPDTNPGLRRFTASYEISAHA